MEGAVGDDIMHDNIASLRYVMSFKHSLFPKLYLREMKVFVGNMAMEHCVQIEKIKTLLFVIILE